MNPEAHNLNAQQDVITDVRMSIEIMTYVLQMFKLQAPFQGVIVLVGLIQGLRAKPLALGYPLPRLRRWLS